MNKTRSIEKESVDRLAGNSKAGRQTKAKKQPSIVPLPSESLTRLLNRVTSFYHQSFCEDNGASEYLKSQGVADNGIFRDFRIGFSNGTLLNTIPEEGEIPELLKQIGILNDKGQEVFYGCVVFPVFNDNSDCVDIYGHRTIACACPHVYLPGPRKGVFNYHAAKRSKALILTESIIDALILHNAGFKDVIPCPAGLTEDHLRLFAKEQTKEVYICFDEAKTGSQGAKKVSGQLKERGIDVYMVRLPDRDAATGIDIKSFFLSPDAPLIFEDLLKEVNPGVSIRSDRELKDRQRYYEKTDAGFVVQYSQRRYEVLGIDRDTVRLKVTVKAVKLSAHSKQTAETEAHSMNPSRLFHLDTVDLYSNRSRLFYAKACAVLFKEAEDVVTEDMARLIDMAERWQPEPSNKTMLWHMTKTEEDEALDFLKSPSLFEIILGDLESIGITGESGNKLVSYIAATSRKLDEPLSVLIQSRSAAGKSTLQDAVISLIPPEDCIKYTRLTGQALFYKEQDSLVHKLLAIEEGHGAKEASYSIRNIQSSKYLSIAATGKEPVTGKLKTEEYRVKGPVALMLTTTEVELDYETSNRFITLSIDESREMTERILQKQRQQDTLEGLIRKTETERIARRHHNAQRLLRPLHVVNPYAAHLSFPAESLRARRDHKKYLGLIKAIAFMHQYQREIKSVPRDLEDGARDTLQYIEVTLEDIEKANRLAGEVLGRSLDELSPPSRLLLRMIREMVGARCKELKSTPAECHFSRKDIREWSRWSDFQVKCHIRQLEDMEYLYSITGKKGKEYIYELLYPGGGEDGRPFLMGLTGIEQLKEKVQASEVNKKRCADE